LPEIELIKVNSTTRERISSHLTRLRKRVVRGSTGQREEFETILQLARTLAKQDAKALPLLAKLIGRSSQSRAMTRVLTHQEDSVEECSYRSMLFDPRVPLTKDGRHLDDLKRKIPSRRDLFLGVDLVLPWPWSRRGIINSLGNLRPGGAGGSWRQDSNHRVELWFPLGIGWVHGGNHSITAGIVQATGRIKPEITYDVSRVYNHVVCDGLHFKRRHDNSVIGPVADLEIAALFEIGRLINRKRVEF
jgi:hypothetical protein